MDGDRRLLTQWLPTWTRATSEQDETEFYELSHLHGSFFSPSVHRGTLLQLTPDATERSMNVDFGSGLLGNVKYVG